MKPLDRYISLMSLRVLFLGLIPIGFLTTFLSLLVEMAMPVWAEDTQCDSTIIPEDSERRYQKFGNRCEGFYKKELEVVGSLNVVSVLTGTLDFDWKEDVTLEVSSPIITKETVKVRAIGKPLRTYYRMDARLRPRDSLLWPVKDIIFGANLRAHKIGVFGWVGTEVKKKFVPLKVIQKGTSPTKSINEQEQILLVVRPSVEIDRFAWRSSDLVDQECSKPTQWKDLMDDDEPTILAGTPWGIVVPESETGELCMYIAATKVEGENFHLKIHILVPSHND